MAARTSKPIYWSKAVEAAAQRRQRIILDGWSTAHTEHRIPTSQGETLVIDAGEPDLPAVVLLPGSMATSVMWLRTMSALAPDFRVISVDIIGDAGFSAPSRPALKSDAHARWLDDVLDALHVDVADFAGASFGGWLALDYAIRRSSRVRRLVLLAPAGVGSIRPAFMLKAAPLLFLGAWGHRKALGFDMGLSAQDRSEDESAFVDLFDTVRSGFVARMQPIPVFSNQDLGRIAVPVLTIVGGNDAVFDSRQTQRRLESNASNCEVLMLPDAGHGLVDTTTVIREFLLRTKPVQLARAAG